MAGQPLVLTPGMGIGPEVSLHALAGRPDLWGGLVLAGRRADLDAANRDLDLPLVAADALVPAEVGLAVWDPGDAAEPAEVGAIRAAVGACRDGRAAGLVTGPIHKARLAARGFAFRGHTDFLAHLCGVPAHAEVMAFHGPRFGLALVTTHIPLAAVPAAVTPARVAHVARVALRAEARTSADPQTPSPRSPLRGAEPGPQRRHMRGVGRVSQASAPRRRGHPPQFTRGSTPAPRPVLPFHHPRVTTPGSPPRGHHSPGLS